MFKINKSIIMICLISLFLLLSQASAAESSLSISDINSIEDNSLNDNGMTIDEEKQDSSAVHKNPLIMKKSLVTENISFQSIKNNDLDNNDDANEIFEEKIKDTEGVVMSGDNFSCGPASLATSLNRLGLNLSLSEVSAHTNTSENGTNMQSMIDAAKFYNFTAVGVEIKAHDIKENSIVHLNIGDGEHWTVVSKVTESHIFLADSSEGNINMSIDEFNALFTGKAILISKINETGLKEEISNRNISILSNSQCLKVSGKGWKRVIVGYRTTYKWGWITKYSWMLRPKVVGGHVSFTQWEYVYTPHVVWGKYKVKTPIYKMKYIKVHI